MELPLHQINFYNHNITRSILLPDCLYKFKSMLASKLGILILPVFHNINYRAVTFIDYTNMLGRGPHTLVEMSGRDKKKCLIISESLENYMQELH